MSGSATRFERLELCRDFIEARAFSQQLRAQHVQLNLGPLVTLLVSKAYVNSASPALKT